MHYALCKSQCCGLYGKGTEKCGRALIGYSNHVCSTKDKTSDCKNYHFKSFVFRVMKSFEVQIKRFLSHPDIFN